jgi:hypothetical protein
MSKKLHNPEMTAVSSFSAATGEEIGLELGAKMVKRFYDAHPEQAFGHLVGRNILEQMLAQPGCEGLSIHPAYDESGERTLVFAGVDIDGQEILQYTIVGENGNIEIRNGIISDKIGTGSDNNNTSLSWV